GARDATARHPDRRGGDPGRRHPAETGLPAAARDRSGRAVAREDRRDPGTARAAGAELTPSRRSTSMDLGLKGKSAIVAAASRGLGRAAARGLAGEGARVAICARSADELAKTADAIRAATGAEVLAVPTDVLKPEAISNLINRTVAAFGGVDILVTNAG